MVLCQIADRSGRNRNIGGIESVHNRDTLGNDEKEESVAKGNNENVRPVRNAS